jgi:hypothetical protein
MGAEAGKPLLTDVRTHEISGPGARRPGSAIRLILLAPNPVDECRNKREEVPVSSKDVRITVVRRSEIDVARLAEALLDLVASLDDDERDQAAKEGAALLQRMDEEKPSLPDDGSAA